jgi:2-haloalkanoic acid dehalogenase type II
MTAVRVAERCGWGLSEEDAELLSESLPAWTPFPDTNSSLTRLVSAGVKLGILSNVDEDLLSATRRHLPVSFDLVVTAQSVRSYKPGHAHFLEARSRLGSARWLHAAQSYFHDVVPCKELGIPVAWINRKGEAAGPRGNADQEFRDLASFANWMVETSRA